MDGDGIELRERQPQSLSSLSDHDHDGSNSNSNSNHNKDDDLTPFLEHHDPTPNDTSGSSNTDKGEKHESSGSTNLQVAVNIVISFVGAGLLGVPETFSKSGWLLGSITLCIVSALNIYTMLLLPKVKRKLERDPSPRIRHHPTAPATTNSTNNTNTNTNTNTTLLPPDSYSAIGRIILGPAGETLVNICLVISQCGFATAYLIFIAANVQQMCHIPRSIVCFGCVPGLCYLVQAQDMKTLSPFSLVADVAQVIGLSAVLVQDFKNVQHPSFETLDNDDAHDPHIQMAQWSGILNVIAITIYSMEGVGLIISLEKSCKNRSQFPSLLKLVVGFISLFMAFFGTFGYFAFGDQTKAPITLNLEGSISAVIVKCSLCVALYLTYPVMMFPVWSILEKEVEKKEHPPHNNKESITTLQKQASSSSLAQPTQQQQQQQKLIRKRRCYVVFVTSIVAYTIPDFGKFLAIVGSSICTILGFLLPTYFHLYVFDSFLFSVPSLTQLQQQLRHKVQGRLPEWILTALPFSFLDDIFGRMATTTTNTNTTASSLSSVPPSSSSSAATTTTPLLPTWEIYLNHVLMIGMTVFGITCTLMNLVHVIRGDGIEL